MARRSQEATQQSPRALPPTIAFLPSGDVWEDFYGTIGVSLDSFCREFTGSWHIRLIESLKSSGIETTSYYSTTLVKTLSRYTHAPTGSAICLLPAPRLYRAIRGRMIHPHRSFGYPAGVDHVFGSSVGTKRLWLSGLMHIAPYLATPLLRLAREIRREGCSAILCDDYEHPSFDRAILMGRILGLPVFSIFQGGSWDWNKIGCKLRPITMKACSGFIIGPAAEAQRVHRLYGIAASKIHRIFNPLDRTIWEPADRAAARKRFGISPDAEVVVWHGRVDIEAKQLDILLAAWKQVCEARTGRELQLALLGSGQDSQRLRQMIAEMSLKNIIWFDEFVSDRKLIRYFLATGDVYAFPSRFEGLPSAPAEAMACGLPVVSAAASGIPDIFEGGEESGGIIVESGNVDAFAHGLGRLLDDRQLSSELGERGRRRAKAFSLEQIGRQLAALLVPRCQ